MRFLATGFPPLDQAHRDLDRCLLDLRRAVSARDLEAARGWSCLLSEMLAEHFTFEEALMRARGWSQLARHAECHARLHVQVQRFRRRLDAGSLTPDLAWWALLGIPEMMRFHAISSDFGFGKFALGLAQDPGPRSTPVGPRATWRRFRTSGRGTGRPGRS